MYTLAPPKICIPDNNYVFHSNWEERASHWWLHTHTITVVAIRVQCVARWTATGVRTIAVLTHVLVLAQASPISTLINVCEISDDNNSITIRVDMLKITNTTISCTCMCLRLPNDNYRIVGRDWGVVRTQETVLM